MAIYGKHNDPNPGGQVPFFQTIELKHHDDNFYWNIAASTKKGFSQSLQD